MALTADQTAILELLLAGQGFAELGELLGLDEDEVRLRAREALRELGGSDPDRSVGLSAYLLGQADPIGRADAVRHLRQDAEDHALATELVARLREIAPGAALPELPAASGRPRLRKPAALPPEVPGSAVPPGARPRLAQNRLYLALGAAAIVLVAVVLAVSGVFAGDDESAAPAEEGDTTEQPGEVPGEEVSRIPLEAVGNGDASGEGIVGITTADQPYIDIRLQNLEPAPRDQVYVIWFLFDQNVGYPLSPIAPDAQGSFADRFAVPSASIPVLERMRYLNVSLAPVDEVRLAVEKALDRQQIVIQKPGRTVLQNVQPLEAAAGQGAAGAGQGAGGAQAGG